MKNMWKWFCLSVAALCALVALTSCGGGADREDAVVHQTTERTTYWVTLGKTAGGPEDQEALESWLDSEGFDLLEIQRTDTSSTLLVRARDPLTALSSLERLRDSGAIAQFFLSSDQNAGVAQKSINGSFPSTLQKVAYPARINWWGADYYTTSPVSPLSCASRKNLDPQVAFQECKVLLQGINAAYSISNLRFDPTYSAIDYINNQQRLIYNHNGNGPSPVSMNWEAICPLAEVPTLNRDLANGRDTYSCSQAWPEFAEKIPPELPNACRRVAGMSTDKPIIPSSGEKFFHEPDVEDLAPHPLTFERTYRTQWQVEPKSRMGAYWSHNHAAVLRMDAGDSTGNTWLVQFGDGALRRFTRPGGTGPWINASHADALVPVTLPGGELAWRYTRAADDSQWVFLTPSTIIPGPVQTMRQRDGWTYTYIYNPSGQLFQVRNQFNRTLELTYHPSGLLATVKAPDNKVTSYTWDDATARLMRVTYPDTKFIKYHYEDTRFPQYITGITDENDKRYQTVSYDSLGRAEVSTLAGDADRYSVNYNGSTSAFNSGATITDPIGTARTFGYSQTNGHTDVVNGSNLPGCKGEPPIASRNQNATTGLLERETDFRGNVTQYTWDNTRQLVKSITRALGTVDQQVTSIDWHATLALPSLITEPLKTTKYDYYPDGRLQKVTVTHTGGETPNKVQITQYTYTASGLLETLTEPNNAVTTYSNHNSAGLPQTITKPLQQVTTVTYDDMGRPKHIVQPDGLVRDLDYEDRGWLKLSSETANGVTLTTQYTYINSGQLKTVTYPSGYVITFTHDDAQRVKGWTDNRGQGATYVLDGLGNIRTETVTNSGGLVARKVVRDINAINRLSVQTFGDSVATTYGYDANGQLASIKDAANWSTNLGRDAMTRVSTITNALQKEAKYSYNNQDAVLTAKDFNGVTTVYKPDAQNQPAGETSPDRGSSGASYDALNLPASVTDAMGRATVITRDLLGRPTLITQSAAGTATLSTELRYDLSGSGCNAVGHPNASKGRLCEVITKVGTAEQTTERYQWDSFGRLTRQEQVLSTAIASHHQTLTTLYSYQDSGGGKGERATMTYPSGAVLTYQYDLTGRLSGLLWNGLPLIESLKFNAVGQPLSWTWAFADTNSATTLSATRGYDSAGFLLSSEFGTFTPNSLGQISAITQSLYQRNAAGAWVAENVPHTATYDALGRLKTFTAAGTSTEFKRALAYDWDDNGNRKLATFSEAGILRSSAASVIGTGSNRLERLSSYVQTTNAAGEHLQLDSLGLAYDNAGRLSRTTQSEPVTGNVGVRKPYTPYAPATHFYNGLNQRVLRENTLGQTVYVYGSDGHNVVGEYQPSTSTSIRWSNGLNTEHVWLPTASGPMPVAAVINGEHFAVHSDHLNTPRRLTDKSGTVRWQWAYSGFGEVAAQSLTTATLPEVRFNLRYPGQVDDGNGLFYNWNRFYHPGTGRYTKADPIGLDGGWNRFAYAGGDAVSRVDLLGLWATDAHNYFIDLMFPNLPAAIRDIIKEGSAYADKPEFQGPDFAFMHAMSSTNMSADEAQRKMCEYIKSTMADANDARRNGNGNYWFLLGMALHPAMDSTSPAHEGFQMWHGIFQDGNKHGGMPGSLEDLATAKKPFHANRTLQRMRDAFNGNLKSCGC